MLLETICILILSISTAWSLWNDRNGDVHPNHDLVTISLLDVLAAVAVALINRKTFFWLDFLRALVLGWAMYVALFPYLVNWMLYKRGVIHDKRWFDHLSTTAWPDRLKIWRETPWYGRMFFCLIILGIGIGIYACPYKISSYENHCFCAH